MSYPISSALNRQKSIQPRFYTECGRDHAAFVATRKYRTNPGPY